ncbi:LysM peptidoglycan-binding domain-containing protein [Candidatus Gracilibacteria bacterium]|nr:LysM peptidoglycan-binding domain-containing protein [Candidatus Gracilibacteria bacterium]
MDTLKVLRNTVLALSLSTQVSAQVHTSNTQVQRSLSGSCAPEITDFSGFSESYTIEQGDTFSSIAVSRGIAYADFLLYLQEFNPKIDIDRIRPGETYKILSSSVSQDQINQNRVAIEQGQHLDEVISLWEKGDIQELEGLIGFNITPTLPINLGLRRFHQVTANMTAQGYRNTARSALPRLEHIAVCKNTVTQYVHASLGFNTNGIVNEYSDILAREGGAWLFPGFLEDSRIFTRVDSLDLRESFNRNFGKGGNAILDNQELAYSEGILELLEYLRTDQATGAYIPTLFHYTGYAATAREESGGRDMNSHIFLTHGVGSSVDFDAFKYNFIESLTGDIRPALLELARDQGGKYFSIPSDSQLLSALSKVHEFIGIELKYSDGGYLALEFDEDLKIMNLENINVSQVIGFRVTGSVVSDGLQTTQGTGGVEYGGENPSEVKVIEHRLLFDWLALGVGHHVNIFHPTSVLQASPELLDASHEGIQGNYSHNIPIKRFFDITREELLSHNSDPRGMYLRELSLEVFGVPYDSLYTPDERARIDNLYQTHSLALQILGYHSFGGRAWNPGATDVNSPIPLLNIFSSEDSIQIQELYREYILEKRAEYMHSIEDECTLGNHQLYPVIYIKIFPGDSPAQLWSVLELYITQHNEYAGGLMNDMLEYQKQVLISAIFGHEISSGNMSAGDHILLDADDTIEKIIQVINEDFVGPDYISLLSEEDRNIINTVSDNGQYLQSLAYFIIKEGYVPDRFYQEEGGSMIDILENFLSRLKRKDLKRYFALADQTGLLEWNQDIIDGMKEERGDDGEIGFIEGILREVPSSGPNSWGDLQMRFANLLQSDSALLEWPTSSNLNNAINLVLDPSGDLELLLASNATKYPDQYMHDIEILREIRLELDSISPDGKIIYDLLTQVLELNDETNRYLVGKVISISLNRDLYSGSLGHLCEQLRRTGESCDTLTGERLERFLSYSYLAMNKGTGVALSIITENYLIRVFESLYELYPDVGIPKISIAQSSGFNSRPILNYFQFIKRIEGYIEYYEKNSQNNSDVQAVILQLRIFLESDENRSMKHYTLLSAEELKDILSENEIDISILPTMQEINTDNSARSIFFSYNAERHVNGFIVEPEQKPADFTAPFLLFMFYGQASLAMISGLIASIGNLCLNSGRSVVIFTMDVIRTTRKVSKYRKIKNGFKQFIFEMNQADVEKSNSGVNQFIKSNRLNNSYDPSILSNEDGSAIAMNYYDGHYKITNAGGIEEFRAGKKFSQGDILSNEKNSPVEHDYRDGEYITRITGEVKKGIFQTILVRVGDQNLSKGLAIHERIAAE